MIRTIVGVIILIAAVLWLPLWVQLVLFAIGIIVMPYAWAVLLPAIFADALYAPTEHFSLRTHWVTLIVIAMLIIHWYVLKKTRRQHFHGLEA